ncbi:hypothetical protein LTR10_017609 [Elasticomyces elasticus]|uniref:Uncharacterized protein n=1 Tax=Exophiala sideris TaxID=1016849 RepID=A0ABR0JP56_9EURO|nr:hypothetical protein LTR10_017609 [Elasticomyces elasticus]KAK5038254.1 hypothetical protein LTS07_001724 [Exophiala sideris]KAK5044238.1 hypothetical protein LTR13_000594 [Exophiala sideris]KAK5067738.1 hypothetical protein LTR69_001727 [Exophiala sideris]KAK5184022.1 hypothetical protein LTR44_003527 [Eurotiomycetes sp. CCFEE 6388]
MAGGGISRIRGIGTGRDGERARLGQSIGEEALGQRREEAEQGERLKEVFLVTIAASTIAVLVARLLEYTSEGQSGLLRHCEKDAKELTRQHLGSEVVRDGPVSMQRMFLGSFNRASHMGEIDLDLKAHRV